MRDESNSCTALRSSQRNVTLDRDNTPIHTAYQKVNVGQVCHFGCLQKENGSVEAIVIANILTMVWCLNGNGTVDELNAIQSFSDVWQVPSNDRVVFDQLLVDRPRRKNAFEFRPQQWTPSLYWHNPRIMESYYSVSNQTRTAGDRKATGRTWFPNIRYSHTVSHS